MMPESVDVAIVGGGIAGASVAYHLAMLDAGNIVVLEGSAIAAGASGRASGLVSFLTSGHPAHAALLKASADMFANWERLIGMPAALERVGGLLPAPESERPALEAEAALMRDAGHEVSILSRKETQAIVPDWDLTGIDVAAFSDQSGYIDPPMVTTALMNRARSLGVRVYQGAGASSVVLTAGKASGVVSNRGEIRAPIVIAALGAWSGPFLAATGLQLDVWPERHEVAHIRPPASLKMPFPVCGDRQIGVYFRPERGGLITAANTGADDRVADPAIFRDEPDPLYGRWILERLASRLPVLRGGEVVGSHAGVYLSGADDFPIIGAVPGVAGLYCVMDTAGNGMTSSPGLGRALAESIVLGKTFADFRPFRPGRFAEGDLVAAPYRHGDAAARLA